MGAAQRPFHSRHDMSRVETTSYLQAFLSLYLPNRMFHRLQTSNRINKMAKRVTCGYHRYDEYLQRSYTITDMSIYLDPIPSLRYPIEQQVAIDLGLVEKHVNEYDDKVVLNVLVSKLVTLILLFRVSIHQLATTFGSSLAHDVNRMLSLLYCV